MRINCIYMQYYSEGMGVRDYAAYSHAADAICLAQYKGMLEHTITYHKGVKMSHWWQLAHGSEVYSNV